MKNKKKSTRSKTNKKKSKQASAKQTPDEREWNRATGIAKIESGRPWTLGQFRAMNRLLNNKYDAIADSAAPTPAT